MCICVHVDAIQQVHEGHTGEHKVLVTLQTGGRNGIVTICLKYGGRRE